MIQLDPFWWLVSLAVLTLWGFMTGFACGRAERKSRTKDPTNDQ